MMKNYVNNKKYDDDYGCDYKQVLMILKMMWGNLIVITMAYTSKKKLWFWRRRWWWYKNVYDNDRNYETIPRILMILTTVIYFHDKTWDCKIVTQIL